MAGYDWRCIWPQLGRRTFAGGFLTDQHQILGLTTDWRWTFFINVPIGIVVAVVIAKFCPSIKHDEKHYPDYLGAVLITVALAALVLAVDNTELVFAGLIEGGVSLGAVKLGLASLALVSTILFIFVERRARQPILPLRFFRNRTYSLVIIAITLFGAAFLGSILYLTQFNQQVFGASASEAGLMLLPMVGGLTLSSITVGQLASRTGRYKVFMVTGFLIGTVSILSLSTLSSADPYWQEALRMTLVGLGLGMAMPLMNLAVQNEFKQSDLGAATASVQLFRGLGSTIGTAVLSGVLTAGVISSIGDPSQNAYIQTLKSSSPSSQMLEGEITTDALLRINSERGSIAAGATKSIESSPLPAAAKSELKQDFLSRQATFGEQIIEAFTSSLQRIFLISGSLMALGLLMIIFIKERRLSD